MIATIFSFVKGLPSWVWIGLIAVGIVYGSFRAGRTAQRSEDELLYNEMVSNADTLMIPYSLELPKPNKPQVIQGKVFALPESIQKELTELRQSKITNEQKIKLYDSLLVWTALPFESTYEDAVQRLIVKSYPSNKTIFPFVEYKDQSILIPQITQTLKPPKPPFYKTGTAKVIYGIIGAGCIYQATQTRGSEQMYWSIGAVSVLTIGISL
jgi:hypothetical protein